MVSINGLNFEHLIGREVGTSTLLKEHARGGMAVVFIAYQRTLKRQIAVKILPKSLLTPSAAENFQQEAEAAAILSHPNIVTIYEVGETEDFLFITMQLVKGRSLSEYIKIAQRHVLPSKRFLSVKATIKIVAAILDALDYAHRQDIIHRDIKPSNVLIEAHTSRPILTDFGIAWMTGGSDQTSRVPMGTPLYMAPEQVLHKSVDSRSDIYAAGVTLFEMLVSFLPLPPWKDAIDLLKLKIKLKDDLFQKKASEMNPRVGREMDEIVSKAVSYDPKDRYANCREFLEALEDYQKRCLGGQS